MEMVSWRLSIPINILLLDESDERNLIRFLKPVLKKVFAKYILTDTIPGKFGLKYPI